MLWTPDNSWGAYQSSTSAGAIVVPGVSGAEGSYVQAIAAVANDSYMIDLFATRYSMATRGRDVVVDVGIDPAGGTSYTILITDVQMSSAEGIGYKFPVFIPAGASVALRGAGQDSPVGNSLRVNVKLYQKPSRPEAIRYGYVVDTFGWVSAARGTAFTPGASEAEGAWVALSGSLSHDYFAWEVGLGIEDGSNSLRTHYLDLSYGDATNKVIILQDAMFRVGTNEDMQKMVALSHALVPAGNIIYGRGTQDSTNADVNFSMIAYGVRC